MQRNVRRSVQRKINFFRVSGGFGDDGLLQTVDLTPALDAVELLPFVGAGDLRYMESLDGEALLLFRDGGGYYPRLRFCRVRRNALPQLEWRGFVRDVPAADEEGLVETVHLVLFPGNVVGVEYNHNGPRVSALGRYLQVKSGGLVPAVLFSPIFRADVFAQLNRLEDIRWIFLRASRGNAGLIRQSDRSLGAVFDAALGASDEVERIEVRLTVSLQQRSPTTALNGLFASLSNLVTFNSQQSILDKLDVHGRCGDVGRVETVDLLLDQVIGTEMVLRMGSRSRVIDSGSAYEAIENSYGRLLDDIRLGVDVASA